MQGSGDGHQKAIAPRSRVRNVVLDTALRTLLSALPPLSAKF